MKKGSLFQDARTVQSQQLDRREKVEKDHSDRKLIIERVNKSFENAFTLFQNRCFEEGVQYEGIFEQRGVIIKSVDLTICAFHQKPMILERRMRRYLRFRKNIFNFFSRSIRSGSEVYICPSPLDSEIDNNYFLPVIVTLKNRYSLLRIDADSPDVSIVNCVEEIGRGVLRRDFPISLYDCGRYTMFDGDY